MSADVGHLSRALAPRYRVTGEVGRGGMAIVYAGDDLRHDRRVAIKVMSAEAAAAVGVERFRREMALVAQFQHPHIVPLLDSGEVDGRPYFVMPLIEGESLRERLRRQGQLSRAEVVEVTRAVAGALDYAHSRGVVHRDIKPENILLSVGGALVADFGVAALPATADAHRLTATGLIVGTPLYMSPEQATADRAIDGRSDVYSLACVVYEALAGHPPFAGSNPREVMARHVSDQVPPLRSARPDLPSSIEDALRSALAKAPADRPTTAAAFFEALSAGDRGLSRTGRARRWLGVAAGIAAAAIIFFATREGGASAVFGARDWLLIASVDNRSGDSLLGDDLGGALAVALEQSRFANVVTRPMVASALQMMGRPDTTRLTRDVAREVAQRLNARAVVHPSVDPAATGVDLTLHVVAAESGSDLVRESATAPSRGEVLATLGRLAEQLRRRLGERLRDEPPQTALEFATSPSLDALRLWSEGQRLFRLAKYDAAIASYKDALALDSNFARAHNSIAVSYYWLNNRERGDFHFDRAQALTGRLTERERLTLIADAANWRGRSAEAINGYERLLQRYPDDRRVRGQLAYALLRADRDAEAADNYEALLRVDSTNFASRINLATALVGLGKLSEALPHYARAFALGNRSLADNVGLAHEYAMAMSNAGFPDSARLLLTPLAKGTVIERASLARTLGLIHVTQGSADSALRLFREAEALSMRAGNPTTFVRNQLYVARTLLLLGRAADAIRQLSQVEAELKVKRVDPPWIADAATVAASAGDLPRARRFLAASEARADLGNVEDQGSVNRARAAVALAAKKINDAVSAAESSRAARADMRTTELLGRVYEAAGRLADARDRHAEVVEQPWGAAENVFARAGSLADAARLSFVLGDSAAGRRYAEMLLTAWPREDGGIPLRARVAALIRPQP